jgi:hypothetical protein
MRRSGIKAFAGLLALPLAVGVSLTTPVAAQPPPPDWHKQGGWDHGHGDHGPPRGHDYGHHDHDNTGAVVGGTLLGLGVGALLGGALAAPPPVVYSAPPPAYYPPPPPPPPVYYGY